MFHCFALFSLLCRVFHSHACWNASSPFRNGKYGESCIPTVAMHTSVSGERCDILNAANQPTLSDPYYFPLIAGLNFSVRKNYFNYETGEAGG